MFYSKTKKAAILRVLLWGVAGAGKSETLSQLRAALPNHLTRGCWLDYASADRDGLFLEYLPVKLGRVKGVDVTLELFSAPGQSSGSEWLELVPEADGFVVVIDSAVERLSANLESTDELRNLLSKSGKALERIPTVCQLNKRDLKDSLPPDVLHRATGLWSSPELETVAPEGLGVLDVLQAAVTLNLRRLNQFGASPAKPRITGQLFGDTSP